MSSAVVSIAIVLFALCILTVLVVRFARRPTLAERAASWPVTEGIIQLVGRVLVNAGRSSYSIDVGDFSYSVNHEYYSGRLTLTRSFSTHDASPKELIGHTIQVSYNQQKPEQYFVPQTELAGFLLDPYDEPFGQDVDPIDLNLDKI